VDFVTVKPGFSFRHTLLSVARLLQAGAEVIIEATTIIPNNGFARSVQN
jgi:hypothetical protein